MAAVWSSTDLAQLKALAGKVPVGVLAHRLRRPISGVRNQARRLGLKVE